jgi:phage-related protein
MATFTIPCDYASQATIKPRVLTAQFGDGYGQRVADGLLTQFEIWTLNFSRRTPAEWDALLAFLEARNGVEAFDWTSPLGTVGKWICTEWTLSPETAAIGAATAKFERVWDSTYTGPGGDLVPPSWSGAVTASSITTTTATISWPAATDAVGLAGYRYSLDNGASWSALTPATSADLTGLTAGTTYGLQVKAYDTSGNAAGPLYGSLTTTAASGGTLALDTSGLAAGAIAANALTSQGVTFTGDRQMVTDASWWAAQGVTAPSDNRALVFTEGGMDTGGISLNGGMACFTHIELDWIDIAFGGGSMGSVIGTSGTHYEINFVSSGDGTDPWKHYALTLDVGDCFSALIWTQGACVRNIVLS